MFLILLLLFIVIPVVELSVLIQVGHSIGSLSTVLLVLLTAVVGVSLVRSQGLSTMMQVQQKLARGEAPGQEIVEGMMLAVAGLFLLLPGFVTDTIGLLLLTPLTRIPVASFLYQRMQKRAVANGAKFQGGFMGGAGQQGFNPFEQQSPFERDDKQGHTFDGDFEHKADPSDKRPESHQVEDKNDKPESRH